MGTRLQVLLDDREFAELRATANRNGNGNGNGMTVSAWVRKAIRVAHGRESAGPPSRKLVPADDLVIAG